MQKKLIALAIAGLSSAAFAQSNVTVYGVMDLGQAWVKTSDSTASVAGQRNVGRLDSNSSYIGFKGAEALGNGLTAVFQLETTATPDSATATSLGSRDSFIGLAGGFGTVAAGTLTHPLRAFGAKVELTPGAAGFGTMASVTGYIQGVGKTGADDRATNAIAYISPSFSGFTVIAAYVNGENKPNGASAGDDKAAQIALQYDNGPLFAGLAYHKRDDLGGVSTTDARVWRLAAAYNFGSGTKVTGLYDNTKVETAGGDLKRNAWSLGVAQAFGASTIGLEYARANDVNGTSDTGNKIVSLVYTYDLSKRTQVHARYSKLDNEANARAEFYNNPVTTPGTGSDSTGYMVGLRHTF